MLQFTDYQAFKAYLFLHQDIKDKNEANIVINDLENEKNNWNKAHTMSKADDFYPQIFLTLADAYFKIENYDKSIDYLHQISKKLEGEFDYKFYFEHRECAYRMLARNHCYKDNVEEALKWMRKAAFNNLQSYNTLHYDNYEFYSFRSVSDYSIADLRNETVSLSNPSEFNDPVDSAFFPWLCLKIQELHENQKDKEELFYRVIYEAYSNVRARCFVRKSHLPEKEHADDEMDEVCNTLMWSHYADYHKGFCVKYVFPSSLTLDDDKQKHELLKLGEINYVESMGYNQDLTFNQAFFTKSRAWEYENEKRLFYYNENGSPEFVTINLPEKSLKAVFIGLKCSDEDAYKIRLALEDKPWVKIYRMVLSREDIYKIKPLPITIEEIPKVKIKGECCFKELFKCLKNKFHSPFKK